MTAVELGEYPARIARLVSALGSMRAVEQALGVPQGTLQYRIDRPAMVRREHVLAAEMLEATIAPPHACTCNTYPGLGALNRGCPVHGNAAEPAP